MDNFGEIVFYGVLIIVAIAATIARAIMRVQDKIDSSTTKRPLNPAVDHATEMHPEPDFMWRPSSDSDRRADNYASMPYFSYENDYVDDNPQTASRVNPNQSPVTNNVSLGGEVWKMEDFDLRKAVIYQTILQNNYISETR